MKKLKLSKNDKEIIQQRIERFKYLRENRVSQYQAIYTGLLATAIALIIELVSGADIFLKIILICFLLLLSMNLYRKSLIQTQKPILVCPNGAGTIEKSTTFKDENGMKWIMMSVSDAMFKKSDLNETEKIKKK